MNCLIISNGHGEDTIATNIIKALLTQNPALKIIVIPLIGQGLPFNSLNVTLALKNPSFPSGGFIRSIHTFYKDCQAGLLSHLWKQRQCVKKELIKAKMIISIGDFFCLWMSRSSKKPHYFFPTAKSETFMPHSWVERWGIRRWATKSFPRDQQTTKTFLSHGLSAAYYGNPMMDNLITDKQIVPCPENASIIGLLPGSRQEGIANCTYLMKVCQIVSSRRPSSIFLCAFPSSLSLNEVNLSLQWEASSHKFGSVLTDPISKTSILFTSQFLSVINQANVIIGLAGTANEQAIYLKKPVICFEGFGPQSTLQRFKEQQQLMGDLLHICFNRNITKIADLVEIGLKKQTNVPPLNQNAAIDIIKKEWSIL